MEDIAGEFGGVMDQEWREKIEKEIKGSFQELLWQDENKLVFQPYYRKSDLLDLKHLRQIQAANKLNPDWKITQLLNWDTGEVDNCLDAMKKALDSGANSVVLKNDSDAEKLETILIGNRLDNSSVMVRQYSKMLGKLPTGVQNAVFLFDPISDAMVTGEAVDIGSSVIGNNTQMFFDRSNFKLLIDGSTYKNYGSNQVQELAFMLQHAAEYFDFFTEQGIKAKAIAEKMIFHVGIGTSFFSEIAKIRALRYLWHKLLSAFQIDAKPVIIAESSSYFLSVIEPYNNLMRETTQVLSAAFSNCDFITSPSFDLRMQGNNEFANRMARNIQIILKEESYANKVIDPSAGSYFIEEMTDKFAEAAWDKFIKIESDGGVKAIYGNNEMQTEIEKVHQSRLDNLMNNKLKMLGVNIHVDQSSDKTGLWVENTVDGEIVSMKARNLSSSYLRKEEKK